MIPSSVFNYVMAVTNVSFRDYFIGCVGFIPRTMAFIFIGTMASGLIGDSDDEEKSDDSSNGTAQLIVLILSVIATLISVITIRVYSKRALESAMEEERLEHLAVQGLDTDTV